MYRINITRLLIFSVLLLTAFSLTSCTIAKISGRGSLPLVLNNLPTQVDVMSHFKEIKMITFDYTSSFDVSEIIAEKLADSDADAVTNITIIIKSDPGTFIVNLITLGLANARMVEVEGDLVKVPGGFSSIFQDSQILAKMQNLDDVKIYFQSLHEDIVQYPSIVRTQDGYAIIKKFQ